MSDLLTKLEELEEAELDYVFARSEVRKDAHAYKSANINKATFYGWPRERREYLNELALELKRTAALKAKLILSEATQKAAEIKVSGLDHRDERIKQSASTEILDRMLGKPKQGIEHTGEGGRPIEIVEVIKADGD